VSGEENRPTVLFVEDEPAIYEPFSIALDKAGFEVLNATTAGGALDSFGRSEPDFILLDLTLPDGDGRDVCLEIRKRSDVPILMLTARGTETDRVIGLELGADDYVVKPFSSREVISRMGAILRRSGVGSRQQQEVYRFDGLEIEFGARRVSLDGKDVVLSRKEFDLLAALAREAGEVVTREELMARVWDVNWFGSTKTLDVHIRALRKKLGDSATEPRFIHTVRGVGFRLSAAEEESS
jgi:two-component system response regulator RegX3